MDILRIVSVSVKDSTTIEAKFTAKLSPALGTGNVIIESQADSVPSSTVLKVDVLEDVLTVTCQPLTPLAAYSVQFISTSTTPFKSLNGNAIISNDGITNKYFVVAPTESDNVVQEFLINYLRENIYDVTDTTTIVNQIVQSFALFYSKALYDIRQLKNENYLSFQVNDELKTRGTGPFDRLDEEGAYEITRVAKSKTGTNATLEFEFSEFTSSPITLLSTTHSETLLPDSENKIGNFNINEFTLNVSKENVSKLKSVIFIFNNGDPNFTYSIETLGYQIKDSRYDQDYGFTYVALETNQFRLSETILSDEDFSLLNVLRVEVEYEYRNLGRIIDPDSVEVSTILTSSRETLPPIINIFNLDHAPIVDGAGEVPTTGGLTFIDPNALDSSTPHDAFKYELPFRLSALPSKPGEYSVDYATGTVYVYGNDNTNSGTTPLPPLVTYKYKYTYKSEVDYVYDEDFRELVALPNGSLIDNAGNVTFNYEEVLVPGIDYEANVHEEVLDERVENRLIALNAIKVENSPITNVFRVFNETSGEIYTVSRWSDNKVYYNYNNAPRVEAATAERVSFADELNEVLFVNSSLTNSSTIKVYKFLLDNNNLIASSEDCIGSSINTPVRFSNIEVFESEKWFNPSDTETINIDRLTEIGQYQIDYSNGVLYCAVANDQSINVGTISYKKNSISPINSHVLSVDDIYYRISTLNPKDKVFGYSSFTEGVIIPAGLEVSDETFLNTTSSAPYQVDGYQIGAFVDAIFVPGVTNNIKFLRGIYEFDDLKNSTFPLNFSDYATFSGNVITLGAIEKEEYSLIEYDIVDGYYVNLNLNLPYLSPNITFTPSVVRNSDSAQLWDNGGTVVAGSTVKLILSGINTPAAGESIIVTYSLEINNLSRVIVDYNKGDLYADYTYLADEIVVSYEWGENVVDFRQSLSIATGEEYYVSYKVGALRDALLKNFGSLVNIPELTTFDINLERERYRDALSAALESFIQGPTLSAIKNIVHKIAHIEPEIVESVFENWSLGSSLLYPQGITSSGEFSLQPAKYGNGVLINSDDQTITFPVSSNLRVEEGTFEAWVLPEWNGIDNDSILEFTITRDGYALESNKVFIGSVEEHPEYSLTNTFKVSKKSNVIGSPNKNKDGIFIYYDEDSSGLYNRWFVDVVDGYTYGNVDGYSTTYSIKVTTVGSFYDVKSSISPKPSNMRITSGTANVTFTITDTNPISQGISFVADREHYILDFGEKANKNRFSLYKDPTGYLNFRVIDRFGKVYSVSSDVSTWKAQEKHHVAISWILNSKSNRDELHLFIDGFEVPNIIKYGSKVQPYLHEKFRTINPEEIVGLVPKTIVGADDLITTAGSADVDSDTIVFTSYGIAPGDTIYIDEPGFNTAGYTVNVVNGNTLTLSTVMPSSITAGKFSVNRTEIAVKTAIDIYPNIAVSTLSYTLDGADMATTSGSATVTSASTDFTVAGVQPGYLLRIDNNGLENHYVIVSVSGNNLVVNDEIPSTLSNQTFYVYPNEDTEIPGQRALRPSYSLEKDGYYNNVLVLSNSVTENDLVWIKTLGLNHRRVRQKYYQWGSDGYETNVIQTVLPPPVSLDEVKITHILLDSKLINSLNASLLGNDFTSSAFATDQPSISDDGRTLSITITSSNLNFVNPVVVSIDGYVGGVSTIENVNFTETGTVLTANKFESITSVTVTGTVVNTSRSYLVLSIKEAYPITTSENSVVYPAIRYSYQTRAGTTLVGTGGTTVTDGYGYFNGLDIGSYLVLNSPGPVVGTYKIIDVDDDHKTITLDSTLAAFTSGVYQVLNASTFRGGFQNGFFILEEAASPGQSYGIKAGLYEFDYYTYLTIKMDPINENAYLGTDINGKANLNGVLDEVKITINQISDIRIGEVTLNTTPSITKDFNSLKELKADSNTLVLAHFNTYPFANDTDFYIRSEDKKYIQSGVSVNDNFSQSLCIKERGLNVDNNGILDTKTEGTVEFWVNPMFDTANDPNYRFYFDAAGLVSETVTSLDDVTVQTAGRISKVLSVKLKAGDQRVDYFVGGYVETATTGAVSESVSSLNENTVLVSKEIRQVVTVKVVNDPSNTDYFANGTVSSDGRTIYLGRTLPSASLSLIVIYKPKDGTTNIVNQQVIRLKKRLPSQKTEVVVTYIPSGLQGDRISIYKDDTNNLHFDVRATNVDFQITAPISWARNTWHRVKASYKFNKGKSTDEIRLFVDGYEYSNVLFGSGLIFGSPVVFGLSNSGFGNLKTDIKFKDFPTELYIGSDYTGKNSAYSLIDNFRISNISRPVYTPFGDSIDVNYNKNTDTVYPVTEDLYTTLLLDFDTMLTKNEDFAILKNKKSGIFDFSVNVLDSFGIVNDSEKVQEILEKLIKILKPANSRVFLKYIR